MAEGLDLSELEVAAVSSVTMLEIAEDVDVDVVVVVRIVDGEALVC